MHIMCFKIIFFSIQIQSLVAVTMVFSFREEIDEKTFGAYDQVDGSKCDEPCECKLKNIRLKF